MIRLKQTMGNTIKCKVDAECMISQYECNILSRHRLTGIFECKIDKETITYVGDVKKNLCDKIESGVNEENLLLYIKQIVRAIQDIRKVGLNPEKLVLHPEWIFFEKDETTLKILYCPVNGSGMRYDAILFMHELVFLSNLSTDACEKWNHWLKEIFKTGITEKSFSELEKFDVSSANRKDEWDDEALTGMEEDDDYTQMDDDREAFTGIEEFDSYLSDDDDARTDMESFDYMQEDDEALTGWEDDSIFSGSNKVDGTHMESVSEAYRNTKVPQLERVSTGEKQKITKEEFKIGRSIQRADFCICGNTGVSNVHATILCIENRYYLKDNHSTNGTYVDGVKIMDGGEKVPLRDGSVIRVYNEDIIFNL